MDKTKQLIFKKSTPQIVKSLLKTSAYWLKKNTLENKYKKLIFKIFHFFF